MVTAIHHINFLVRNLDQAIPAWEALLGRPIDRRDELPERGVVAARFRLGSTWLVLVQPVRPDSVPGRHLAAHGEGFFLLSLGVESLAAEEERLGATACQGPRRVGADGWLVRDVAGPAIGNGTFQLCEDSTSPSG